MVTLLGSWFGLVFGLGFDQSFAHTSHVFNYRNSSRLLQVHLQIGFRASVAASRRVRNG